ncbi:MAG: cysteine synthase [Deltaproteobacteria bacterium]|nr:cysteine synthase [Deltaproteobacteria bacterium]
MNDSILSHIGNTPLVPIRRMNPNPRVTMLAKVEYVNPGGSIKDRPALFMIEDGERSGQLTPDKIVIEATSGNTGIGLALVCAIKGYRLLLTMSEAVSQERQKILKARGARIMLTPGHLGTDGAIEEVYRVARESPDLYFMTDQFNNPANWQAHYHTTANEIWTQTNGSVTHVVATMGTTGTLMGVSRRLKELNPAVSIIGVEPYLGHKIQGLKNLKEAYVPEIFEKKWVDEKVNVDDDEAYETARRMASEEGLFVGMSSGAALAVARRKVMELDGGVMVVILPDGGERYLSTNLFTFQEKVEIKTGNTLTRGKDAFTPARPGKAGVFCLGPVAAGPPGLSECRRFILSDLLCRYLAFRGLSVNQVMNITDIDDRTIEGSEKAGKDLAAFTKVHADRFFEDMATLGVGPANHYPKTSEHTDDMTALSRKLADRGFAYEKLRSLYFSVSHLPEYGRLSGVDLEKIRLGATVDLSGYEKDNPRDFTLFKRCRLAELKRGIFVKTEWGNVRPSWPLQCAAMSMKYLGENYDFHVGSLDLVFPLNENENAICLALSGKPLARNWIHCEAVYEDGQKVGGSHGLRMNVDELLDQGFTGREIRFWLLATHYGRPLSFSAEKLVQARKSIARLDRFAEALSNHAGGRPCGELDQILYDLKTSFQAALDDDLSISAALSAVFGLVKRVNALMAEGAIDEKGCEKVAEALKRINEVVNVFDFSEKTHDQKVDFLLRERREARASGDFARADAIRLRLIEMGHSVRDSRLKGE